MTTNIIIFFLMGLLFGGLSLFIWKYNHLDLISGYDPNKVKDKKGLAKWYGQFMFWIALTSFVLSIANFFFESFEMDTFSYVFFFIVASTLTIIVTLGRKKFYQ
jgi:hypothetical protein